MTAGNQVGFGLHKPPNGRRANKFYQVMLFGSASAANCAINLFHLTSVGICFGSLCQCSVGVVLECSLFVSAVKKSKYQKEDF